MGSMKQAPLTQNLFTSFREVSVWTAVAILLLGLASWVMG